jgi:FkbM family methyltransferase
MNERYIILSKGKNAPADKSDQDQIIYNPTNLSFLLPATHMPYYSQYGLNEDSLIEWSKQFCRKDAIFLDIGAHTGSYAITMAPYAKKVFAFEPQRMTYYALCGGVALSGAFNVECCPFGLGDESQVGNVPLYIVSTDGGGSTIQTPLSTGSIIGTETVSIRTLDSLELPGPISFIKIDVEQNEKNVLEGGIRTIQANRPVILFEQNDPNSEDMALYFERTFQYTVMPVNNTANMFLAVYK